MPIENNLNKIFPKDLDASLDYGVYGSISNNKNVQVNRLNLK